MNVTCPECGSVFRVDPNKVPASGVRARCSVCGGIIEAGRNAGNVDATHGPASEQSAETTPTTSGAQVQAPEQTPAESPPPIPPVPTPAPILEPAPRAGGQQPRVAPRRVNPYLSNDPTQRARRLARALVSDLVAYHPEKREEGLRAGTLKELFRDDIRKSWQEYVEQVGAPLAEGTPHFQDALNDILAGGRRVF